MRNRMKVKKWNAAVLLGCLLAVLLPLYPVQADQVDINAVVSASAQILYTNEGSYSSVNPNDNGAVSIGKLQWHGWRALSLLQSIVSANETQAKSLLGNTLYKEVTQTTDTTKWSTRKLSSSEASAVGRLLATNESRQAQDELAVKDITSYIEQAQRLGIKNEAALVYFADLTNQGGSGASGRVGTSASKVAGSYEAVTLNELHEAAVCDSVMGAYPDRRFATYKYAAGLGWTYCNASDSYIPYDYASARESGAAWVQRALNTCMNAGLAVTDIYDQATIDAVTKFQTASKLQADGYAGRSTIIALIKDVFRNVSVTQPDTPIQNPDDNTPGQDPDPSVQNPDTADPEPGLSSQNPGTANQQPDTPPVVQEPEQPSIKTVLKASKTSYGVNDTQEAFMLDVTSSHTVVPVTYESSNESVATVRKDGKVTITGPGQTVITASQEETGDHTAAELKITVEVYSTNPSAYSVPTGALYAGKNMKTQHVQWLQASLMALNGADITVNGTWSSTMTKLVTSFQSKCAIEADGIAGDQTQSIVKKMLAVKNKKATSSAKTISGVKTVSWGKYTNANRVYIYRKEKGGTYTRIKTITNMKKTSYQDKTAKKGTTYYYAVQYGFVQGKMTVKGIASKNL